MTEKLKCPFCNAELRTNMLDQPVMWYCPNHCIGSYEPKVWKALIDGKKAQDALNYAIGVLANLTEIGGVGMQIIKIKEMAKGPRLYHPALDLQNNTMDQLTIYELLQLLRPGFVAMDEDKSWYWFEIKPVIDDDFPVQWTLDSPIENWNTKIVNLSFVFNIAPYDGDWKDSLMECGK